MRSPPRSPNPPRPSPRSQQAIRQNPGLIGIADATTPYYVYQLEGIQPGTDSVPFGYGELGPCQDPPECLIEPWVELLLEKAVFVTVQ